MNRFRGVGGNRQESVRLTIWILVGPTSSASVASATGMQPYVASIRPTRSCPWSSAPRSSIVCSDFATRGSSPPTPTTPRGVLVDRSDDPVHRPPRKPSAAPVGPCSGLHLRPWSGNERISGLPDMGGSRWQGLAWPPDARRRRAGEGAQRGHRCGGCRRRARRPSQLEAT